MYEKRRRICDAGVLREAYRTEEGGIGFRCASEPEQLYTRKGGVLEDTVGRKCLCNCLMADIGMQQIQKDGYEEPGLVTLGDDLECVRRMLQGRESYSAAEVVAHLLPLSGEVTMSQTVTTPSCAAQEAVAS